MKGTNVSDRLIVALDTPTHRHALELVDQLDGTVRFFKVGLELFANGSGLQLIDELINRGFKVFADFKFLDIPKTVERAVRNLNGRGISFLTVHAQQQTMKAAVDAAQEISILAVTVLTSIDDRELQSTGYQMNASELVRMRSVHALEAGCAGVISSPKEANLIREETGDHFLIVTPGIRENRVPTDDQKRTMSIAEACKAGVNYFVVGRPIRDANDPKDAALKFQSEISNFEQLNRNSE